MGATSDRLMPSPDASQGQELTGFSIELHEVAEAAQQAGVTVADLTKFAFALTLRKFTREDDVVFGEVLANRDIPVQDADRCGSALGLMYE